MWLSEREERELGLAERESRQLNTPAPAPRPPRRARRDPLLAQWWRRLLGWIIDCLVLLILTGALWVRLLISFANRMSNVANASPGGTGGTAAAYGNVLTQTLGPFLVVLVATACLAIGYNWLLTGYWGTTIGKRCVGAWVVSAADNRSPVSPGAALVRAVVFVVVGWAIPVIFLLDNGWLLWDRRRQCLHDKVARTVVVKTAAVRPRADG
jgi:uncharacterized RDD family membrane protein YckC